MPGHPADSLFVMLVSRLLQPERGLDLVDLVSAAPEEPGQRNLELGIGVALLGRFLKFQEQRAFFFFCQPFLGRCRC